MSKHRQQSSCFSHNHNSQGSSKKNDNSAVQQTTKEQKAIALINQGKLLEAESIYKQLIAEGTRNHIVYGNLSEVYGRQGKLEERIKLLGKALKINPNYTVAHNNLGNALQEKGDLDAAISSYKKQFGKQIMQQLTSILVLLQKRGDLIGQVPLKQHFV